MPVAVNISFGNTYGARDGTSLFRDLLMTFLISGRAAFVSELEMKGNRRAYIGEITRKRLWKSKI